MSAGWTGSGGGDNDFEDPGEPDDMNEPSIEVAELKTKDSVVILIDCAASMHVRSEEGDHKTSPFRNVLKLVLNLMKEKIIHSRTDQVGVCLYNTKRLNNTNGFAGINVFISLDEPSASMIQQVNDLLARDERSFEKEIGVGDGTSCHLYQALWACSVIFTQSGLKNSHKRIFLFTNNDYPNRGNVEQDNQTMKKLQDLAGLDIHMELFPMDGERKFDLFRYWVDVLQFDEEEGIALEKNFDTKFKQLQDRFRKKQYQKRSLASVALEIAPDIKIAVKLYCLVKEATKEPGGWLDARNNHPLTTQTRWLSCDSGAHLEEREMRKVYPYGGDYVGIDVEELKTIKYFGEPGLTLMGFKDLSAIKIYYNIKVPYFMYPDEADTKGSATAFAALMEAMLKKNKVAICRLIYRRRTTPRFVALVPQPELVDRVTGVQTQCPGLHMVFLPYNDDLRDLKFPPNVVATAPLVHLAKQVVHKMFIFNNGWDRYAFENPALQKHYATLQALALDEPPGEAGAEVKDLLMPDAEAEEGFHKDLLQLRHAVQELGGNVEPGIAIGAAAKEAKVAAAKRKREEKKEAKASKPNLKRRGKKGSDEESDSEPEKVKPTKKRVKKEASDDDTAGPATDYGALASAGQLGKLTVPELKDACRGLGIKLTGKKGDLVDRLMAHFGR